MPRRSEILGSRLTSLGCCCVGFRGVLRGEVSRSEYFGGFAKRGCFWSGLGSAGLNLSQFPNICIMFQRPLCFDGFPN